MSDVSDDPMNDPEAGAPGPSWRIRLAIGVLIVFAVGVVLFTNQWLTQRFTETTRSRA